MKEAHITPALLSGCVTVPPSKSYAHRALIAAALADGTSVLRNVAFSQDILATLSALKALGAKVNTDGDTVTIQGIRTVPGQAEFFCKESGSTLRFLVPLAAALGVSAVYYGEGRLPTRPLSVYHDCFKHQPVRFSSKSGMPFTVTGKLTAGVYELDGNISSQFITGLLFALPLLNGKSEIRLRTPLESADYVQMTIEILKLAQIQVIQTKTGFLIPGGQQYQPFSYTVEGDYSQAAFFLTAGAIGTPVTCKGLLPVSMQGDRKIIELLQAAGAMVTVGESEITVSPAERLVPFSIDGSDIPDLVPILSVLAACCEGVSEISHIGRLKLKESDRIHSTAALLRSLGVSVQETEDRLSVTGKPYFESCTVDPFHDHRIAMSAAIASLRAGGTVVIQNADCVNKSYPDFFRNFNQIGGKANVITLE